MKKRCSLVIPGSHHSAGEDYSKDKVDLAIEMHNRGLVSQIVPTDIGQAKKMYDQLIESGVPQDIIKIEDKAESTGENVFYTRDVEDPTYIVYTYHNPRVGYWHRRIRGKGSPYNPILLPCDDSKINEMRRLFVERILITLGQMSTLGIPDGEGKRIINKYRRVEKNFEKLAGSLYKSKIVII